MKLSRPLLLASLLVLPITRLPGADSDDPYGRRGYYPGRTLGEGVEQGEEAIGTQVGKVTLRVGVVANFTLKPSGEK